MTKDGQTKRRILQVMFHLKFFINKFAFSYFSLLISLSVMSNEVQIILKCIQFDFYYNCVVFGNVRLMIKRENN